jgi:hypothetical protein
VQALPPDQNDDRCDDEERDDPGNDRNARTRGGCRRVRIARSLGAARSLHGGRYLRDSRVACQVGAAAPRYGRRRSRLSRRNRRLHDEAIAEAGDGLDEARVIGVVVEGVADLADRAVDAVVGVGEDALAPDLLHDLLAAHQLAGLLREKQQDLHRDALEPQRAAGAAQLPCPRVELEAIAEANRRVVRLRVQGAPPRTFPLGGYYRLDSTAREGRPRGLQPEAWTA